MESQPYKAVELFISYAHEDEKLCKQLINHLAALRREALISSWYDRDISAGADWHEKIIMQLRRSVIILLLVSPDFIESDYINDVEVKEAMARHEAREALVIPVILRPADWKNTPFGKLQALPRDGRPVTSWRNQDEAFLDVVQGIRNALGQMSAPSHGCNGVPEIPSAPPVGFVSRKDKRGRDLVEYLKVKLAPSERRFIMLSGLEGVGKTKLAAEVARQLEEVYKKCVVWSDAGNRVDYTLQSLLDDIATQLGHSSLRTLVYEEKEEQVRALLAKQPTLVVVDSYEMIVEEERGHIDELFEHVRCSVLYVSLRMKVDGKTTNVTVPPMWPEESDELVRRLVFGTQTPGLFTPEVCSRIHNVTDGRPVLIEWVVQQIDTEPEEPDEVFKKVARGEGDVLQRVFNRSFELLSKDGRAVLFALSLFPSSATREVLGCVVGLNNHRLKVSIRDLRTLMLMEIKIEDKHYRFTIKGITRKLAGKLLLANRRTSLKYWRNFVKCYQVQVDKYDWIRKGPFAAPLAEKSNILRAMQFASYIGAWDTLAELYCKTKGYIHSFNVWRKAMDLAEREAEEKLGDNKALSPPIIIEIKHKDIKKAQKCYEKLKKKGDKKGDKILKELEENSALDLKRGELPVIVELSVVEFELGVFAYHQGRHSDARKHYEKAKRYKKLTKDWRGFATVCNNLGGVVAKEKNKGWMEVAENELKLGLKYFKRMKSNFTKVVNRNLKWLKGEVRSSILNSQ
jgi:hypothetical protein